MGMFDSFYLKVKCPYCGEITERMEFQTKQFECMMNVWNEGDKFNGDIEINSGTIKNLYGGCNSDKCNAWQTKQDGYKSGFGRMIYCDVLIEDGIIKKAINIRKDE